MKTGFSIQFRLGLTVYWIENLLYQNQGSEKNRGNHDSFFHNE